MEKPSARKCSVCGKTKGVTWHAAEVDGQMRHICAHPKCFIAARKVASKLLAAFRNRD